MEQRVEVGRIDGHGGTLAVERHTTGVQQAQIAVRAATPSSTAPPLVSGPLPHAAEMALLRAVWSTCRWLSRPWTWPHGTDSTESKIAMGVE